MAVVRAETLPIAIADDVVRVRQMARELAVALGFSLVDQTKIVTAASELARNTLVYGGGGTVRLEALRDGARRGLRLTFEDQGPGIADIELALTDGYTTGGGLGLGLGGAKRLSNEFEIDSAPGQGTRVTHHALEVTGMRVTLLCPIGDRSQVGEARRRVVDARRAGSASTRCRPGEAGARRHRAGDEPRQARGAAAS